MGYLFLASAAASLCALGVLTGCPCGCASKVCWALFHGLLAGPSLSSLLGFSRLLWVPFSHMVHTHSDGVEAGLSSIGTKVRVFPFPFWDCFFMLSLPLGFWSPYGSECWLVLSYARPTVFVGATHFLLLVELRASVCGSSFCPVALGWSPGGPSCGRESSVVLSSLQRSSLYHVLVTCLPPWHRLRALGCPWCLTLDQ